MKAHLRVFFLPPGDVLDAINEAHRLAKLFDVVVEFTVNEIGLSVGAATDPVMLHACYLDAAKQRKGYVNEFGRIF